MWIIRWVVLILIIVTVLGFALQNQSETVTVTFLRWESGEIPLYLALFMAFGFGMVAFLLIAVFQQLQTLSEMSGLKRRNKKLESEIEELSKEREQLESEFQGADEERMRLRRENAMLADDLEECRDRIKGGTASKGKAGRDEEPSEGESPEEGGDEDDAERSEE